MASKIYQLSYDDAVDRDINEWLEGLPRNRKAELVRHAIRFYIMYSGEANAIKMLPGATTITPIVAPVVVQQEVVEESKPKKRKPSLPKDGLF